MSKNFKRSSMKNRIKNELSVNGLVIKETKRIGYCHNMKHHGYLNLKLMKEHQCLEKECPFFKKVENNDFWARKRASKEKRNKKKELEKQQTEISNKIKNRFKELLIDYENTIITEITKKEKIYNVRYVTLDDVHRKIEQIKKDIETEFKIKISLNEIKNNNTIKQEIINKYKI